MCVYTLPQLPMKPLPNIPGRENSHQQCQDQPCPECVEGQIRSHLHVSMSGSKLHLGDVTVDMPWPLTLGRSGVGVHKPEGKKNKDGGPLT